MTALRGEWSTYQANTAHDGYVAGTIDPTAFRVIWTASLPNDNLTAVAVGGGKVFVGADLRFGPATAPNFFALDEQTGAVSWQHTLGSIFSVNGPAFADGVVYEQAGAGIDPFQFPTLYAWDAASGAQIFAVKYGAQFEHYLAPTIAGNSVYINGGSNGGMYSFDARTGQQNWFTKLAQFDLWTPAVSGGYCYAYTGSNSYPMKSRFSILDSSTGAVVSNKFEQNYAFMNYSVGEAPALGSSNDAFVTNGGRLLKYATTPQGELLQVLTDQFAGQPSVSRGIVYVADGPQMAALSESDGSVQWRWTPDDKSTLLGQSVITDNLLFTSTQADVYAIDLVTGQTVWSHAGGGALAISDGMLFVQSDNSPQITAIAIPEPAIGLLMIVFTLPMRLRRAGHDSTSR